MDDSLADPIGNLVAQLNAIMRDADFQAAVARAVRYWHDSVALQIATMPASERRYFVPLFGRHEVHQLWRRGKILARRAG
jgi:hypothetical protein